MSELVEYIEIQTECTIYCKNCGKHDSGEFDDEFEAAEHFESLGWNISRYGNVYCPECSIVKLLPMNRKKRKKV